MRIDHLSEISMNGVETGLRATFLVSMTFLLSTNFVRQYVR